MANEETKQVRLIGTAPNADSYFYWQGVTASRAAELAAARAKALCVRFDYMEIREGLYGDLTEPPILTADIEGKVNR